MRKIIQTTHAPAPIKNVYNQGVLVTGGSLLFTAGQVGMAPGTGKLVDGGIEAQTRQALENVKAIIEAAGSDMAHVVKVTVLLNSIDDFAVVNEIYKKYFSESPPARTAFEAARLPIGTLIEVDAIAAVD